MTSSNQGRRSVASNDPTTWTLVEAAGVLRRREISAAEYLQALLSRIDACEGVVRAWVTLDRERALAAAEAAQALLDRRDARPLLGLPVGIKDIFNTAGLRTSRGSPLYADFVPREDAEAVKRLRRAGAFVLGKTVTTEFAFLDPSPTRNPWHPGHTPGGSSSGSAAAVAAGMCPAALGSQTAGSLLRPAAYCGVVSLKPSFGRVSRTGMFPDSPSLDHPGVFTRSVADAALLLGELAGADLQDPDCSNEPIGDYLAAMRHTTLPPRIGLVRSWFFDRATGETRDHLERVVSLLRQAGAVVEDAPLPGAFSFVHDAHRTIMQVEMTDLHSEGCRERAAAYGPRLREYVETGRLIPAVEYVRAKAHRTRFIAEMAPVLERFDVLLTPTTPAPAPAGLGSTGDPAFNVPWTFAGIPAMTLPSGVDRTGLPFGIQLAAPAFAEGPLLAAARWCEEVLDFDGWPSIARLRDESAP